MAEKKISELEVKTNMKGVNLDMKEVVKQTKEAKTATKDFNDVAADTSKKSGGFKAIKDSVTNLVPGLKSAEGGVNSFSNSLKMLLANPIVLLISAIVGGLALLFKAFTSTKDGADKFAQVMKGVSAIIDVVRDRILNVGNAIVKFFSGDFKGALAEGKKAVSGFGAEVTREFKAAANATRDLQRVEDAFNRLSVSRAKVNRDLAISKELLTDENATFEEKRKALEKIKKLEGEQTAQELKNARKKYESIVALNALSDTSREDKKKEQDAMVALIALEEQSARDRRAINKQEKTLRNQEKEAGKAAVEEAKARAKERADAEKAALEKRTQAEKDFYKAQSEMLDEAEKNTLKKKGFRDPVKKAISDAEKMMAAQNVINDAKVKQIEAHNEAELKLEEDKNRKKQELTSMSFDVIRGVADLFAQGNEEDQRKAFEINKAASLGQAIINTAQGVTAAITQVPLFPGQQIIQAGLVGTLGALNIAKIANTQFQSSGSGGGGTTPTATAPRTPSFDIIQAQPQMQLGALHQQPVKAYVVSGEVSTAQALDRNRVRNATF